MIPLKIEKVEDLIRSFFRFCSFHHHVFVAVLWTDLCLFFFFIHIFLFRHSPFISCNMKNLVWIKRKYENCLCNTFQVSCLQERQNYSNTFDVFFSNNKQKVSHWTQKKVINTFVIFLLNKMGRMMRRRIRSRTKWNIPKFIWLCYLRCRYYLLHWLLFVVWND